MRKSKADAAETRKRILSTASRMFLRNGVATTAITDVMVAAGLTKGGFYRHFESKEHLLAEANAAALDAIFASFDAAVVGLAPRQAINVFVHRYLHQHQGEQQGNLCPIANLSNELRNADDQVKAVLVDGYSRFVKLFASYLMRLDYTDYVGLAGAIVSIMVGAVSISHLASEPGVAEATLANAQSTVELLLQCAETSRSLVNTNHGH
jgi:TetR/AcrR family transcriptional repressor of nem operon